jgi:tetratricopeptide (TPR) repeat protein
MRIYGLILSSVIGVFATCLPVAGGTPSGPLCQETLQPLFPRVEDYIRALGEVNIETSPLARRATAIFDKVRAQVPFNDRLPQLSIIDSPDGCWARALADRTIVVSLGAIRLCYQDADKSLGDARMAFILGHELAHLHNHDFWTDFLRGTAIEDLIAAPTNLEAKKKESKADERGFIYAAVAGFPVDRLIARDSEHDNFFAFWSDMLGATVGDDPEHLAPQSRALMVKQRLANILDDVEVYRYGVRLLNFGRIDDAKLLLEQFVKQFPSREVFNNLGFLHIQKALAIMGGHHAYCYWPPGIIDLSTRAQSLDSKRGWPLSYAAEQSLHSAVRYLETATSMDRRYSPAWVNFSVAYFLSDRLGFARAALAEALDVEPKNLELQGFKELIVALSDERFDTKRLAISSLKKLVADEAPFPVRYNLARLLADRGRTTDSESYLKPIREQIEHLPRMYRHCICGASNQAKCCYSQPEPTAPKTDFPIAVGTDLLIDAEARTELMSEKWVRHPVPLGQREKTSGIFVHPRLGSLLVINEKVELVVQHLSNAQRSAQLLRGLGEPLRASKIPGGEVLFYSDTLALLRINGLATELWSVRPSPFRSPLDRDGVTTPLCSKP